MKLMYNVCLLSLVTAANLGAASCTESSACSAEKRRTDKGIVQDVTAGYASAQSWLLRQNPTVQAAIVYAAQFGAGAASIVLVNKVSALVEGRLPKLSDTQHPLSAALDVVVAGATLKSGPEGVTYVLSDVADRSYTSVAFIAGQAFAAYSGLGK